MFRWVFISENVPRDLKTLNANLSEGLQGLNFWIFLFDWRYIFLSNSYNENKNAFSIYWYFCCDNSWILHAIKIEKDVGAKADLFYKRNWNRREGGQTRKGNESFFQYFEIYHHSKDWR